jgi:hypothetical protein
MLTAPQALTRWWSEWSAGNPLGDCDNGDVERMASDIGVSTAEFRELATYGANSADLLLDRMTALDLDRNEVSAMVPASLQDMKRVCSLCKQHRRCARDLSRNAADPVWKDYCPNVATLLALDAMPWAARREW